MFRAKKIIVLFLTYAVCVSGMDSFAQQLRNAPGPDQYRSINWVMEDGLSWASDNFMIKDVKGFMWIGTVHGGLDRFDGFLFKKYIPSRDKPGAIHSDEIWAFREDSLHNIWIGTTKGLARYDIRADTFTNFITIIDANNSNGTVIPFWCTSDLLYCLESGFRIVTYNIYSLERKERFLLSESDLVDRVFGTMPSIVDTASNCIWMLQEDKSRPGKEGLLQISMDGKMKQPYLWPCYKSNADHSHSAEGMKYDRKRNSIWINSGEGLLEFSIDTKTFHRTQAFNEFVTLKDYRGNVGIDIDVHGRIWLATSPKGLLIYDPKTDRVKLSFPDGDLQQKAGYANQQLYYDRDDIVWTSNWAGDGIYEILPYNPPVKLYSSKPEHPDSLSSNFIISISHAANNKLWIGTRGGLNIFDPATEKFEVLREKDLPGIKGTMITPLYVDTVQQKAWIAATYQQWHLNMRYYEMDIKTRKVSPIIFKDGSKQFDSLSILPSLVMSLGRNLLLFDEQNGLFEIKENSLVANLVVPFKTGIGNMILKEDRFLFVHAGGSLPNFTFENIDGKWKRLSHLLDTLGWIDILYNEKDKTHWVSFKYELVHYDKDFNKIETYGPEDGYTGTILSMRLDNAGNLWFANILKQLGRLDAARGIITILSETDGYQKQDFNWNVVGAKDAGGNLYFGVGLGSNSGDLVRIDPLRFSSLHTSFAYMRSLNINHKPFPLSIAVKNLDQLSLRYNQNTISIETGIIDFYAKSKGRLRYKLVGNNKDEDWQYGPAYSTIRYERLSPGTYRLVMQASNVSNEFNGPEKHLVIKISPPYWETWWFRTLAGISLVLILFGLYRWRTATLRKQKRVLEQTVKERTAEVVEEKAEVERQKEKSDELLLNILPSEVAEELKEKGYTTAKSFDEVTVLFSDIKGFTNVAENMSAQELVKEINTYFSAFDGIIQKYGLEKIKTIGDAYIAAGGLPEKNAATAINVVEAAIAMQQDVEVLKKERTATNKPYFELRIGIHTGPVVAGVVGIKKFQYDIWGDTVNLAARMEQSGVSGKINISQHTYELVKDHFTCMHRGQIDAKNKGEIDMYFVE